MVRQLVHESTTGPGSVTETSYVPGSADLAAKTDTLMAVDETTVTDLTVTGPPRTLTAGSPENPRPVSSTRVVAPGVMMFG